MSHSMDSSICLVVRETNGDDGDYYGETAMAKEVLKTNHKYSEWSDIPHGAKACHTIQNRDEVRVV